MATRRRDGRYGLSVRSAGAAEADGSRRDGSRQDGSRRPADGGRQDGSRRSAACTGGAQEPGGALPPWMRLYFYGMHGVALDIVLSSARTFLRDGDLRLLGFSSPYSCVAHSVTHFALERIYARRRSFRGSPLLFHGVLYPSAYIGLQILAGSLSAAHVAVHYLAALYYSNVFYRMVRRLRYRPPGDGALAGELHSERGLPGAVRFAFFGMHGFLDEVLFTSVCNLVERPGRSAGGHTSLWSFLIYGSCGAVLERLYVHLRRERGWGAGRRLAVYVAVIYAWELGWGLALRRCGACPWDYSHYPLNFMGLVTLLYLPGWIVLSLYQDALSDVLTRVALSPGVRESRLVSDTVTAGPAGRPR